MVGGAMTGAKDRAVSALARLILNRLDFRRYGEMTCLTLDSERGELCGTLELKGEEKPVEFHARFHIVEEAGGKALAIDAVWTSREWLTVLAGEFLKPGAVTIPLPAGTGAILKALGL